MTNQYIKAIWRRMWLVLLAPILAGSIVYVVGTTQPRLYEATARLLVGPGVEAVNPDLNDMRAAAQLMWTYSEFVTSAGALRDVIDTFDLPMSEEDLRSQVAVSPDQTTLWLTIRVRSNDDAQAVVIANALANSLLALSPSSASFGDNQVKASIGNQIQQLEQNVTVSEAKIVEYQSELDRAHDVTSERIYATRLAEERAYLSDLRSNLVSLYSLFQETYTNQLTIMEAPTYAQEVDAQIPLLVIIAALAGLIAVLAIVLTFEYFGLALHTPDVKPTVIDQPFAGVVGKHLPMESNAGNQKTAIGNRG